MHLAGLYDLRLWAIVAAVAVAAVALTRAYRRLSSRSLELADSEARYRELVESSQVVFWRFDPRNNCFTFVSREAESLLDFSCTECTAQTGFWQNQSHADDLELLNDHLNRAAAGVPFEPFEHRMLTRNGSVVWVRTSMRVVHKRGGVQELVGFMFDITQRKHVEEAFEQQQRLFEALMNASPERIYFKDVNSRFVRVNRALVKLYSLQSQADALGKTDADFYTGAHVEQARRDEQEIIRTGKPLIDQEEQETWPDGRITWASSTKMPLRDSRHEICGTIGVSRDITERKLAQQSLHERTQELLKINAELERQMLERRLLEGQLVQAQKLESIGQLAAGVAHEINTPIQYVGDNCRFFSDSFRQIDTVLRQYSQLLAGVKEKEEVSELASGIEETIEDIDLPYLLDEIPKALEQCNEGVERVAHIVRAMKEFSHPGSIRMEAVDLNHSIKSTLTVSRNEWKYVAEATTDLDPALPPVRCLVGEINQVLLNIVVNAAHAIADAKRESGGIIAVRTFLDGDMAEIRIRDNGTGIPDSVRSRIFDPFFTTKEVGRGSGQGLAIARNVVVNKHHGTIDFTSVSGQGTEFIIRLPIAGVPADEEQAGLLLDVPDEQLAPVS